MDKLALLAALTLCAPLAQAKRAPPRGDERLAVVDDEPMSRRALEPPPAPDGRRAIDIRAPEVAHVADTSTRTKERGASEPPPARDADSVSDELIAHQMRRNLPALDACVAAAVKRHPSTSGTVELSVQVEDKKVSAMHVSRDEVHDVDLDACLVKSGATWRFKLRTATFLWPVTLSPSASR
jgi:hypothetical protein